MHEVLPPAGDSFADAVVVSPTQLPFTDSVDAGAASQATEPICGQPRGSWWYSFTPTSTESFTAIPGGFGASLAVYTASSPSNLNEIGCVGGSSSLTFRATAGTTYYLQDVDFYDGDRGPVTFSLDHAPQPIARFFTEPGDPSIFDTVQFFDNSFDPGQAGIQTEAWDFGDGTKGTGSSPTHQYAADGDYTATLTVTTVDGRTATASQTVHVSTHDVGIAALTVPARARANKTSPITVSISDKRYPETVQVQLLRSNTQGGFDTVGTLTLSVPVRSGERTTSFAFSYTFTSSDAALGKVTFEATATIQGFRDTFPPDNRAFASTIVH
ncbi:MAG TPA: PKD domain-containing protein [Streptosporangiaceae bacterium]|nr:PKD domain-containing protein [Streptosporangiaceae bacterium]